MFKQKKVHVTIDENSPRILWLPFGGPNHYHCELKKNNPKNTSHREHANVFLICSWQSINQLHPPKLTGKALENRPFRKEIIELSIIQPSMDRGEMWEPGRVNQNIKDHPLSFFHPIFSIHLLRLDSSSAWSLFFRGKKGIFCGRKKSDRKSVV